MTKTVTTSQKKKGTEKKIQTSVVLDRSLFYAIKEIALQRKKTGIHPDTVASIIRDALEKIVEKEHKKLQE